MAHGTYDEDLAIDMTAMNLEIIGRFNLGTFDGSNWQPSGTRRNIVLTGDANSPTGITSMLVITSDVQMVDFIDSTFTRYHMPRISGQIVSTMTNSDDPTSKLWILSLMAEVYGTTGNSSGTSVDTSGDTQEAFCNLHILRSRIRGAVNMGLDGVFKDAEKSRIQGVITCNTLGSVVLCRFNNDWNVNTSGGSEGFKNCRFDSAFTWTGAGDFLVDGFSNNSVKVNGVTLVGGAVKVITADLTP